MLLQTNMTQTTQMSTDEQWVEMGFVRSAVGIKGWLKISAATEYLDSLLDYDVWRLGKQGHWREFAVAEGKVAGNELQVKLEGVDDRDAAESLKGHTIAIARSAFAEPEANEYYWVDLIGLAVYNRDEVCLGMVKDLMQTGAHDVLVVAGEYGQKLIPFVAQYIDAVDQAGRRITVDWGLDY